MNWSAKRFCELTGLLTLLLILPQCQDSEARSKTSTSALPTRSPPARKSPSWNSALKAPGSDPCVDLVAPCDAAIAPPPEVCSTGGWCWKNPAPQGDALLDVWAVDDTTAFAVGPPGQVMHWWNGSWAFHPSGTPGLLFAVWASSGQDVWAVGEQGAIVHWNGAQWTLVHQGGPALRALSGSGPGDVWAGGDGGTLLHWDGTSWSNMSSGTTRAIRAMWAGGPQSLWLSVFNDSELASGLRRWNGQVWTVLPNFPETYVFGFWGFGADDVWVVGSRGLMAHWTSEGWEFVEDTDPDVYYRKVWGLGPTQLWVAGPKLWRFDGQSLINQSYDKIAASFLVSVTGGPQGPLFAVGTDGAVVQYESANQWRVQSAASTATTILQNVNDVWAFAPFDAWAVSGSQAIHWNGMSWEPQQESLQMNIRALSGSASTDLWAVGEGWRVNNDYPIISHFDGEQWTETLPSVSGLLTDVWALNETAAWSVTSGGDILQWNGQTWTKSSAGNGQLASVHGSSADNVWAVGAGGAAFQWNGQQWINRSASTSSFTAVWAFAPENVWMTATDGSLSHWDGSALRQVDRPTTVRLNALFGNGPVDLWATGNGGVILHWNGHQWTPVESGTRRRLLSIAGAGSGLFTVGEKGAVLHRL